LQTTKKYHGQTYVEFNSHITKRDKDTLPLLLKKAGYVTGMVGKNHVIQATGLKHFKNFDGDARSPKNAAMLKENYEKVCQSVRECGFDYASRIYHNNPDFLGLREVAVHNMDWITEGGVEFIKQYHDRSEPFFLYFATTLPHGPTEAERAWNANPLITAEGYIKNAPQVQPPRSTIPERIKAAGLKPTDDTCNMLWVDDALNALLKTLKDTGELDNTVIFFFNDQWMEAKGTVYEGGAHTPGIVWRKDGFKAGHTCDALTTSVDFAPTILELAQAAAPQQLFDGKSFLPQLNGIQQDPGRTIYFELGFARGLMKKDWKYMRIKYPDALANMTTEERAEKLKKWNAERRRKHLNIVTEDPTSPFSHLTAIPGGADAESGSTGTKHYPGYYDTDQLYNLKHDRHEQKNLAVSPEYKEKLNEMQSDLRKVLDTLPGTFN
jgi:arylsulfatase A-like enzyme